MENNYMNNKRHAVRDEQVPYTYSKGQNKANKMST